jgi:hypothetical protein
MNFGQILFNLDSQVSKEQGLLPAYLNQSRMSTWYQDNGVNILAYNKQFVPEPLGGPIHPNVPSGYKSQSGLNVNYPVAQLPNIPKETVPGVVYNGIIIPKMFMKNIQ